MEVLPGSPMCPAGSTMPDRRSTVDQESPDYQCDKACCQSGSIRKVRVPMTSRPLQTKFVHTLASTIVTQTCPTRPSHMYDWRENTSSNHDSLLSLPNTDSSSPVNSNHSGSWNFPIKVFQQAIPPPKRMFYRTQLHCLLLKEYS